MSKTDTTNLRNGQLVTMVNEVSGTMVSGGATDKTCLVQTENGPQLAVKTFPVGSGNASDVITFVPSLPEEGATGYIYGIVMPDITRDNYTIVQLFTWYNNDWYAVGAYDVNINPSGLVYEQSFDAETGTWTVTVEH